MAFGVHFVHDVACLKGDGFEGDVEFTREVVEAVVLFMFIELIDRMDGSWMPDGWIEVIFFSEISQDVNEYHDNKDSENINITMSSNREMGEDGGRMVIPEMSRVGKRGAGSFAFTVGCLLGSRNMGFWVDSESSVQTITLGRTRVNPTSEPLIRGSAIGDRFPENYRIIRHAIRLANNTEVTPRPN